MIDIPAIVNEILNAFRYTVAPDRWYIVFEPHNIAHYLAFIIAVCSAFIFLWWAVRKAFRAIIQATTRGRGKI